jgi:ATP-dependent DNA ligase
VYRDRRTQSTTLALWARERALLPLHAVQAETATDEDEVHVMYSRLRAEGLEGAMVKSLGHTYANKRTADWLKYKPEETEDGYIAGLVRAVSIHGEPLDRIGSITVYVPHGLSENSVATPHGIPHALGAEMFQNPDKYIGQWVEFKYMERDRQGGYRHPTFIRLREAKA